MSVYKKGWSKKQTWIRRMKKKKPIPRRAIRGEVMDADLPIYSETVEFFSLTDGRRVSTRTGPDQAHIWAGSGSYLGSALPQWDLH